MRVIVQKFGGTSVATPEGRENVVKKVQEALNQGYGVVVVVSAMGRAGEPYATDTLIGLAKGIMKSVKPRELDLLMTCGENISTVVMVQTLKHHGIEASAFTGGQAGIYTDHHFGNARIMEIKPDNLRRCLEGGRVAVVAGFQGITPDGEVTTLGRGGSDTTGAALGVALNAEVVEIYTDVDGVMTADPRLVPQAKSLAVMTYNEVCEMAHLGAKVVHPRAVEIAMEGRVPLRIRSTFSDSLGTLITDGSAIGNIEIRGDKVVTGLAHIAEMALVRIKSEQDMNQNGKVMEVFQAMANAGISVDMIQVAPFAIGFIIKEDLAERSTQVLGKLNLEVLVQKGFAKVAIVGSGMRGVPGVMAKMVRGLQRARIAIYHSTDSHINIACLVRQDDMCNALQALHEEFQLGE
ncbi:aspartate kinase [Hydrogenispora ethanolica]|jgi:aspartate kinase|uniref:Aspartokinase n=1 Tax=Hydrogenispora ethanolica TaxID=1082276 RepID=A0A4R1R880_HYDET|nr:aspartate kinase [Hydrogenispora ethanolica]TCL61798.1 aspartate kinase [Hydrogenispora ethanolica]